MYFYNSTLKATHPYSSKWYQWPLNKRPIWYWSKQGRGTNFKCVFNWESYYLVVGAFKCINFNWAFVF